MTETTPPPPPSELEAKEAWTQDPRDPLNPPPDSLKFVTVSDLYPLNMAKNADIIKMQRRLNGPALTFVSDHKWFWDCGLAEDLGRVHPIARPPGWSRRDAIWQALYPFRGVMDLYALWVVEFPQAPTNRPESMILDFLKWLAGLPESAKYAHTCHPFIPAQAVLLKFDASGDPQPLEYSPIHATAEEKLYEVSSFARAWRFVPPPHEIDQKAATHYWVHQPPKK